MERYLAFDLGAESGRAILGSLDARAPTKFLREMEERGDYTGRLAWLEEMKGLPLNAIYDHSPLRRGFLSVYLG